MPAKRRNLERTSIRLVEGDLDRCLSLFPHARPYTMFRNVIHHWLNSCEARAKEKAGITSSPVQIDMSLISQLENDVD